jgi:hypothetical protein
LTIASLRELRLPRHTGTTPRIGAGFCDAGKNRARLC